MFKKYSKRIKQRIRNLRSQGWSLGELGLKTGISKSTISGWVRDIRLTDKQKERIRQKIIDSGAIGRPLAVEANYEKIERWKEKIRSEVKHFGKLTVKNREIGKLICGLLYLCEGAKYPSTKCLVFGNSNPQVIRCFVNLLRTSFDINESKLRCRVMHRCDQNLEELNKYWSAITGIPLSNFYKSKPDGRTKGRPTLKKDYKGICAIHYLSTDLQFRLQAIGETIINKWS